MISYFISHGALYYPVIIVGASFTCISPKVYMYYILKVPPSTLKRKRAMRPSFKSKFLPFVTTALLNLAGLSEAAGAAQVVEHHWTLSNQDIAPDGFVRTASLINGQYPGPLLALNKGDTAYVTVHNDLTNSSLLRSTSIVSARLRCIHLLKALGSVWGKLMRLFFF